MAGMALAAPRGPWVLREALCVSSNLPMPPPQGSPLWATPTPQLGSGHLHFLSLPSPFVYSDLAPKPLLQGGKGSPCSSTLTAEHGGVAPLLPSFHLSDPQRLSGGSHRPTTDPPCSALGTGPARPFLSTLMQTGLPCLTGHFPRAGTQRAFSECLAPSVGLAQECFDKWFKM